MQNNMGLSQPQFTQFNQPSQHFGSHSGGFWSRLFRGTPDTLMQSSNYTQPQQQMFNQIGNMGLQGLLSGNMPAGFSFDPIAKQAQNQFQTETIPSLAERFTSLGGQGGQRSSAFQGALGQAGAGLQEQLSAMKSQYNMGMAPLMMQMLQMGLTPQFQQQMIPGKQGMVEQFISGLLGGGQGGQGGGAQTGGQMASMLPMLLKILAAA